MPEIGDKVEIDIPEPVETEVIAQDIPIQVLYEDDALAVVVKPCGMVVHRRGNPDGTLVNALLHHLDNLSGIGGEKRPGIVHRLDKDTSGILLVASMTAPMWRCRGSWPRATWMQHYVARVAAAFGKIPAKSTRPSPAAIRTAKMAVRATGARPSPAGGY